MACAGTATRLNLDYVLPGRSQPTSDRLRHYRANLDPELAPPQSTMINYGVARAEPPVAGWTAQLPPPATPAAVERIRARAAGILRADAGSAWALDDPAGTARHDAPQGIESGIRLASDLA